jgi:hypothetical protein
MQCCALLPHTLAVPPPPQVLGAMHVPQLSTLPQPSPMGPHVAPIEAHVRGTQGMPASGAEAHWLGTPPPPHICPVEQVPHWSRFPQPSASGPQVAP